MEFMEYLKIKSVNLYSNLHLPDGRAKALVIVLHGIGEHGGCYDDFAKYLVSQSIAVFTYDQRGSGRSTGVRGHATVNALKNDLNHIIDKMQKKMPVLPIILFGHSMGGQIALSYALDTGSVVQGVIASSPFIRLTHPPSALWLKIAKWASYIVPWLTINTGVRAEQLAEISDKPKSIKKDPLLHKKVSIKFFTDLFANGEKILQNKPNHQAPILLMHGTIDALTSYHASKLFAKKK